MNQSAIVLHGTELSGHTHRVVLLLRALGLPYRFEVADGARRASAEFRALNPLGQIPVLQDGGLILADSNAILVYLVRRYAPDSSWLPEEPAAAASVQRWLSIAAGEVRYGPSMARITLQWGGPGDPVAAAGIARRLLAFMDQHLSGRTWLAADHVTLADLACYSYVAHAPEGGIPLSPYPFVRKWISMVEAQPWFQAMPASPLPEPLLEPLAERA
ncbi:glutathione S-transferase family protein [Arenibaculum pallidiluteum]|uniref:glutathione S-transferase family protein n=1 Tax=Arenibaculum pallidiluteum TaxID=2812559 RepID=UPI001A9624A8|nr:glutathione S-transferase [Arenibaculum pallidiluteum]